MGRSAKISKVSRTGRLPFKQRRLARELEKRKAQQTGTRERNDDFWSIVDEATRLREWRQRKKNVTANAKIVAEASVSAPLKKAADHPES
ncbi:hypothetical protein CCYA_CCYA08G2265 [Cyanidiococcus yangmingshanensis]|nr:hypothetical protein CCYA_CCYA08G2265 [Cyanidiococcus yangmingshanensis]